MVLAEYRHIDKWNLIEGQNINSHNSEYLIFDKEAINRKKASSTNYTGVTEYHHVEK